MDEHWLILIAAIGAFAAGFIDAVVGGGGLIQVPLLFILFPNLPHTSIIASNRLASAVGTGVAAFQYTKAHKVDLKLLMIGAIGAVLCAYVGAFIMRQINTSTFKPVLFCIICILAIYTFFKKDLGTIHKQLAPIPKRYFLMFFISIIIGLYNGIFGPGTGALLLLSLVQILGFNFLQASGYAKIINALADGGSLISFLIQGAVWYKLALPMLVMNVAGSYVGSKMAIKQGNSFIRKLFIIVLAILLVRLGYELF